MIENKQTGQKYVGQTTQAKPIKRYKTHIAHSQSNKKLTPFYQDMRDQGPDNFTFKVIETCLDMNLNQRENHWIEYYNSIEEGYNINKGYGPRYDEEPKGDYYDYMIKTMSFD